MPDTIPVPTASGSTPDAPTALAVTGAAAVPVEAVSRYGDPDTLRLDLTNVLTARIRAGGSGNLTDLTIFGADAGLTFAEIVLPPTVNDVVFGTGCAQGDWVDQLIAALPDTGGSGSHADVENILTTAQENALNAKGFLAPD